MIRRPPRSTLFPTRRSSDLMPHLRYSDGWTAAPKGIYFTSQADAHTPTVNFYDFASHVSRVVRSEEHTSELQSQFHLVCRLLLEKKKKKQKTEKLINQTSGY